jgi:hypothetical protein
VAVPARGDLDDFHLFRVYVTEFGGIIQAPWQ